MGHPWFGSPRAFVEVDTPLQNKHLTHTPLHITIPNGKQLLFTHNGELDLPYLPQAAFEAHIVPGLTNTSLIAIRKLMAAGYTVIFDQHQCRVYFQNKLYWRKRSHHGPMANTPTKMPTPNQTTNYTFPQYISSFKPTSTTYGKQPIHSTIQTATDQIHAPNILCNSPHHPIESHW